MTSKNAARLATGFSGSGSLEADRSSGLIGSSIRTTLTIVTIDFAAKFTADIELRTRPWKAFQARAVDGYSPEEAELPVGVPSTRSDAGR
jgi:hypothetical protein